MQTLLTNSYYQIAAIALLFALVLFLISLFSKKLNINRILVLLTLLLVCGGSVFVGLKEKSETKKTAYDQSVVDRYFAAKFAEAGLYEEALEALKEASELNEQADDILALARFYTIKKDYTTASLYYRKYVKANPDDSEIILEAATVKALHDKNYNAADNTALIKIVESLGMTAEDAGFIKTASPTSGVTVENVDEFTANMLKKIVDSAEENIKKSSDKSAIVRAAEAMIVILKYNQSVESGATSARPDSNSDFAEKASLLNKAVRGDNILSENSMVRDTTLIANAYLGSANDVARNICEKSTINELIVASELCIGGYVTDKAFRLMPKAPSKDELSEVYKQCVNIKNNFSEDVSKSEIEYYKALLVLIKDTNNHYIIKNILSMLAERSKDASSDDRSQAFMQLAKGFEYAEMQEQVDGYIDLALESASSSKDAAYAEAMGKVLEYVVAEEGTSINVTSYIQTALERLMPVTMKYFSKLEGEDALNSGFIKLGATTSLEDGLANNIHNRLDQMKITVNIGKIDYSKFPQITVRVGFGAGTNINAANVANKFILTDTSLSVKDIKVKELSATKTRVILLCDNSGSMYSDVDNLKNAIYKFADGMTGGELVKVVAFDSSILFESEFLSSASQVKEYADKMSARGGTRIYNSLNSIISSFADDTTANNIVIVMSDGQDSSTSADNVKKGVTEMVEKYNATIYSVGIGSASEQYLKCFSDAGNGRCIMVKNSSDLDSFYAFIHGQVNNQYEITYTCTETTRNNRMVSISLRDSYGIASKEYYLNGSKDPNEEDLTDEDLEKGIKKAEGLKVNGFSNAKIYQSQKDMYLYLSGENFSKDETYTISINNKMHTYELKYVYVSDTKLKVTIPGGIGVGYYELTVSTSTEKKSVDQALQIMDSTGLKIFEYGPYTFTTDTISQLPDGSVVLKGNTVMNGWLQFTSDILLEGDMNVDTSKYLTMSVFGVGKVQYQKSNSNKGLTKILANAGIPICIPLTSVKLYNQEYDQENWEDFPASKLVIDDIVIKKFSKIGGNFAFYPGMIYTNVFTPEFEFPGMDVLFNGVNEDMFSADAKGGFYIASFGMMAYGEISLSYEDSNDKNKKFQIGKMHLKLDEGKIAFDTMKDEYSLELSVEFDAFQVKGMSIEGFGLALGFTSGGLDSFELSGSGELPLAKTPIPIYLNSLSIGASNIQTAVKNKNILDTTVTGGFGINSTDFLKEFESVKDLFNIDRLSAIEVADAKIAVTLGELNLDFTADVKTFAIPVGKCHVQIGKYNFVDEKLNLSITNYGLDVDVQAGIDQKWSNLELKLIGENRFTFGFPYSGFSVGGDIEVTVNWWFFEKSIEKEGEFGMGLYYNENKEIQFILKVYYTNWLGNPAGYRVDVTKNGKNKKSF